MKEITSGGLGCTGLYLLEAYHLLHCLNLCRAAELGEQHKDEDLAAAAKEAVELILPRRNASLSSSSLDGEG